MKIIRIKIIPEFLSKLRAKLTDLIMSRVLVATRRPGLTTAHPLPMRVTSVFNVTARASTLPHSHPCVGRRARGPTPAVLPLTAPSTA